VSKGASAEAGKGAGAGAGAGERAGAGTGAGEGSGAEEKGGPGDVRLQVTGRINQVFRFEGEAKGLCYERGFPWTRPPALVPFCFENVFKRAMDMVSERFVPLVSACRVPAGSCLVNAYRLFLREKRGWSRSQRVPGIPCFPACLWAPGMMDFQWAGPARPRRVLDADGMPLEAEPGQQEEGVGAGGGGSAVGEQRGVVRGQQAEGEGQGRGRREGGKARDGAGEGGGGSIRRPQQLGRSWYPVTLAPRKDTVPQPLYRLPPCLLTAQGCTSFAS